MATAGGGVGGAVPQLLHEVRRKITHSYKCPLR